jgi:hypothetical protein
MNEKRVAPEKFGIKTPQFRATRVLMMKVAGRYHIAHERGRETALLCAAAMAIVVTMWMKEIGNPCTHIRERVKENCENTGGARVTSRAE